MALLERSSSRDSGQNNPPFLTKNIGQNNPPFLAKNIGQN
jgi:hypothetical protein